MSRKRTKKINKPNVNSPNLMALDNSFRHLQSLLIAPDFVGFSRSGYFRGVREKLITIDYNTIRNLVDRVPIINAIINTRVEQVKAFANYVKPKEPGKGFEFYNVDINREITDKDRANYVELSKFLDQTGKDYDSEREDDFLDYLEMIVRETLTIDQIATELQPTRIGKLAAFWLLDGATIKRLDKDEFNQARLTFEVTDKTRFCQLIEQKITNVYTDEEIIFDYKNKRADIRYRGFGYSPVEQAIDIITTILFGYTYARDQLMRDRVPKGFIQVMGDVSTSQLDAIRDYWYAAMSGAGGQWNIPIVPSGKDGVGIDWKNIQQNNRDMEYHKLMMFMSSILAAVFNIDLAELGIKADDSQAIIGENSLNRIKASQDRGLQGLLSFVEQHINKIIRKITVDYKFRFVGLNKEDEEILADIRKKEVETRMTVNELREADGLEPLKEDYANIVLNPQAIQVYLQQKNAEQTEKQQAAQQEAITDNSQENEQVNGDFNKDETDTEVDWSNTFGKSLSNKDTIHVVIK